LPTTTPAGDWNNMLHLKGGMEGKSKEPTCRLKKGLLIVSGSNALLRDFIWRIYWAGVLFSFALPESNWDKHYASQNSLIYALWSFHVPSPGLRPASCHLHLICQLRTWEVSHGECSTKGYVLCTAQSHHPESMLSFPISNLACLGKHRRKPEGFGQLCWVYSFFHLINMERLTHVRLQSQREWFRDEWWVRYSLTSHLIVLGKCWDCEQWWIMMIKIQKMEWWSQGWQVTISEDLRLLFPLLADSWALEKEQQLWMSAFWQLRLKIQG
jgi:hypothetical protein